jgi:hypothetical protein
MALYYGSVYAALLEEAAAPRSLKQLLRHWGSSHHLVAADGGRLFTWPERAGRIDDLSKFKDTAESLQAA